jgi:hypothetical protein
VCLISASEGIDGCPTFAQAYSGFPVEIAGVGALHAAFLNESRTRGCWWCPVQEIRIRGPKKTSAAQRPLSLHRSDPTSTSDFAILQHFNISADFPIADTPAAINADFHAKMLFPDPTL